RTVWGVISGAADHLIATSLAFPWRVLRHFLKFRQYKKLRSANSLAGCGGIDGAAAQKMGLSF
ncbi:hypothetical protein, partial [Klebsiella michiganensis]|uniref:hypothetical protein n=1 Tax=Klebsiella michiganensis TaxID=1134687 RepID=UPI001CA34EA4